MIKFVDTTAENFERKRKQPPPRACDSCRKKKKRCEHGLAQHRPSWEEGTSPTDTGATALHLPAPNSPEIAQKDDENRVVSSTQLPISPEVEISALHPFPSSNQRESESSADQSGPRSATSTGARGNASTFIGDMNPEGVFLAATSPQDLRGGFPNDNVGVWLIQHSKEAGRNPGQLRRAPPATLFYGFTPEIQQVFLPILERDCLTTLPPIHHLEALRSVYFQKFHPIFPIVNRPSYEMLPDQSTSRALLEQGMCLVASADPFSKHHLILQEEDDPLARRDFGRRVLAAMRVSIEAGMVMDKIVLVQALGLMALFIEGREGSEASSLIVARAVHHLISLGLHMQDREADSVLDYGQTLFCCIWTIDRLNAASQGRPIVMHERDIGRSLRQCFDAQKPAFRLLLHVVESLDLVIGLYRPGSTNTESNYDFCLFEDLILKCDASLVPTDQLATIETLYHAVAILSCRSQSNAPSSLDSPISKLRQAFSTEKVTAIVGHEHHKQLILLPFVSYAVSLSLSVSYREMRRSQIPLFRTRARIAFEENSRTLKQLGEMFWSADVMAEMSISTIKELDRVYTQVAEKPRKPQFDPSAAQTNDLSHDLDISAGQPVQPFQHNLAPGQDLSAFCFTELPEIDPFEMFDPEFDLEGIDACLEGNLDLAVPMELFY